MLSKARDLLLFFRPLQRNVIVNAHDWLLSFCPPTVQAMPGCTWFMAPP